MARLKPKYERQATLETGLIYISKKMNNAMFVFSEAEQKLPSGLSEWASASEGNQQRLLANLEDIRWLALQLPNLVKEPIPLLKK